MFFLGLISLWISWFGNWRWSALSAPIASQTVWSLSGLVVKAIVVALGNFILLWLAYNRREDIHVPRVVFLVLAIAAPFFVLLSKL